MKRTIVRVLSMWCGLTAGILPAQSGDKFLKLESSIALPEVQGRIDHLAIDTEGRRLFVAALGNDSLEVIDLKMGSRVQSIRGLAEPQGITYMPSVHRVFVANGRDGSVRSFDANSWKHLKTIEFGDDADNLRVDPASGHIWVGYGSGALAEFDVDGTKFREIKLDAHPESFQFEKNGSRAFVNLPKSQKIGVVDRKSGAATGSWTTGAARSNYPMALDEGNDRLFVVTRTPARLLVLDLSTGRQVAAIAATGDCDDVFYDARRHRIYAIGGEGGISVFAQTDADHYAEVERVKTVPGARTGLFSPALDRLYVAVRKHESAPAEIRVYALTP